jgi:flagellar hook assembly protein FlgD
MTMLRRTLLTVCGLLACLPSFAQGINLPPTISSDTTLTTANSLYAANSNVTVAAGVTLTIEPAVTVKFAANTGLIVNGRLRALGTSTQRITLTGSSSTPGAWNGVYLETSALVSEIRHTTLSYAGAQGITLQVRNSSPIIASVTLSDSSVHGASIVGTAKPAFTNCTFTRNGGHGLLAWDSTVTSLLNSSFTSNGNYPIRTGVGRRLTGMTGLTATGNGGGAKNAILYDSGTVTVTDTLLGASGIPWISSLRITVPAAVTLTIGQGATLAGADVWVEPGATLAMQPQSTFKDGSEILVKGKLSAIGTSALPITFTTSSALRGSWSGIHFTATADPTSKIADAKVRYGGGSGYANVRIVDVSPTLERVTVSDSAKDGVLVAGTANPTITNCTFAGNTAAGLVNQTDGTINARLNYWSAANGPSGIGTGSGQSIVGKALYEPYLVAAPSTPHFTSSLVPKEKVFNPNIGVLMRWDFQTALTGTWTLRILNASNAVVRAFTGSGITGNATWDGKDAAGVLQPNAAYSYEFTSTTTSNQVATVARGQTTLDTTPQPTLLDALVSEPFFSPNGDQVKDTTALSGTTNFESATWTMNVKNAAGAIVRTANGTGPAVSYSWDGKNTSGVVQSDGTYAFEVVVTAGTVSSPITSRSTVVDRTLPVSSLSDPTAGQTLSNIYSNGNTDYVVRGTAEDANLSWWGLWYGPGSAPPQEIVLSWKEGSAVSNAPIATLPTANLRGSYRLRLWVSDKAGNTREHALQVTVGHLRVTQGTFDVNATAGGTVTYTSDIPFTITERIVIQNSAGVAVRTLVNASRAAGIYNDAWDGRNDQGNVLPDGPYSYVSTVTAGTTSFTWDRSNVMRSNSSQDAHGSGWGLATFTVSGGTNPFANDPLVYQYSLPTASLVQVSVVYPRGDGFCHDRLWMVCQQPGEVPAPVVCVNGIEFKPSGSHIFRWPGTYTNGLYLAGMDCTGVLFNLYNFPENTVVLFGTAPSITYPLFSPTLFDPAFGPQEITFTLSTYQGQAATITVDVISQEELSVVRTLTLPGLSPGSITIPWDGEGVSEVPLAPGPYTFIFTVTDLMGNSTVQHAVSRIGY